MSGRVPSIYHEYAIAYAARGWAVFPLMARDKRPMIAQSKPGANDGGFHLASTDGAQIDRWWWKWPNANIGLRCGEASGVFVLDLDGPGAEAALSALCETHGPLPDTLMQRTGKGRHLIFRMAAGVRNRGGGYLVDGKRVACEGFDVRGEGGYIVLPPSVHPSGRIYAWENETLPAEAPRWLIDAIVPPAPKPAAPMQAYKGEGCATPYGEKALDSAVHRISTALPGTRHNTLSGEAASIGELVAGGEIERGYAERALVTAATAMMGGAITQRELSKISWGLTIGQSRPRRITRDERARARHAPAPESRPAASAAPAAVNRMRVAPPYGDPHAVLLVTVSDCADAALAAWREGGGGAFGLYVPGDLGQLTGGLARNAGGYEDWRLPRAAIDAPAMTTPWRGRVLIVLPGDMEGFTVSAGTKFERFISVDRQHQVIGILTQHWWKAAGATDVKLAVLGDESEDA